MKPGDVICSAVLQQDIEKGIDYAIRSIRHTFDRMHYGAKTTEAYLKRLRNIALGKCAEAAIIRFLRAHGVPHSSLEGATPETEPDRFDLRIGDAVVDIKSFFLAERYADARHVVNALALVPNQTAQDQWANRARYQRYIFVFVAGKFALNLRQQLKHFLDAAHVPTHDEVNISASRLRLFLTAAPTIAECEQKFHRIRARTKCLQYPYGTRIDNMGCLIRELTAFKSVVTWGGV